ncbi:MAG: helix-turn-helix domain-containing protein [Oscillospiraceae bacterium]|nr:helix-turn-helix domain-containing protein [Oscillospiraceae bacterium]
MADKVNTNTLMKRLFKANDLDTYLEGNESDLECPAFDALLKQYCEQRKMLPAHVIEQSQIERTYGHQLFNGTRRPSRDKVLQLALGLGLSVDETQRLLRAAGKSQLYPRLKRDAVILYGIQKKLPILAVQESLTKYALTLLGGQKNGND